MASDTAGTATKSPGRLPDFLIIGAAKAGTTSLHGYLEKHPQVFVSADKEPCFFDSAVAWDRGVDWYRSLFADAEPGQLCGEASTNYTRYPQVPDVPERIAALVPDVKLIYMMRHPVDRAYSHYLQRYQKELHPDQPTTSVFEEFVERDPLCIDGSDYRLQISRYLPHFPRSSFLFLNMAELKSPQTVFDKTLRFLGLDPMEVPAVDSWRVNRSSDYQATVIRDQITRPLREFRVVRAVSRALPQRVKDGAYQVLRRSSYGSKVSDRFEPPPMREETRARLLERYRDSNRYVREELGVSTAGWDQ
ncbi:MAG: sulfotransferase domain-containing protein [Myxococcota bacterium]